MKAAPASCFVITIWVCRPTVAVNSGTTAPPMTPKRCRTPAAARASIRYSATLQSATGALDRPSPLIFKPAVRRVVVSATAAPHRERHRSSLSGHDFDRARLMLTPAPPESHDFPA